MSYRLLEEHLIVSTLKDDIVRNSIMNDKG